MELGAGGAMPPLFPVPKSAFAHPDPRLDRADDYFCGFPNLFVDVLEET
jgi:hypothetical protein